MTSSQPERTTEEATTSLKKPVVTTDQNQTGQQNSEAKDSPAMSLNNSIERQRVDRRYQQTSPIMHGSESSSPLLSSGEELQHDESSSSLPSSVLNIQSEKSTTSYNDDKSLKRKTKEDDEESDDPDSYDEDSLSKKQRMDDAPKSGFVSPKRLQLRKLEEKMQMMKKQLDEEIKLRNHLEHMMYEIVAFQNFYLRNGDHQSMTAPDLLLTSPSKQQRSPNYSKHATSALSMLYNNNTTSSSSMMNDDSDSDMDADDSDDEYWTECFTELGHFVKTNGDFPNYEDSSDLFRWLNDQVKRNNRGTLKQDQFQNLADLGFNFKIRRAPKAEWDRLYEILETLKRETGTCEVPRTRKYQSLFNWTAEQRKNARYGRLSQQRIDQLNSIGFNWDEEIYKGSPNMSGSHNTTNQTNAMTMGGVTSNGHIPMMNGGDADYDMHGDVMMMMNQQQQSSPTMNSGGQPLMLNNNSSSGDEDRDKPTRATLKKKSKTEHYDLWTERYKQLKEFREENGHCKPSRCSGPNRSLGVWVATMRHKKKLGKLTEEQIRKLERIGFEWNAAKKPGK